MLTIGLLLQYYSTLETKYLLFLIISCFHALSKCCDQMSIFESILTKLLNNMN